MARKKKEIMWFGCKPCMYEPPRNEEQSNENWHVYDCGACPKCGIVMRINFEEPPQEILDGRKIPK